MGPTHVAFAYDVVAAGGEFLIYDDAGGSSGALPLPGGRLLRYARGSGPDRNGSGLVIAVENHALRPHLSWLLTGDCDYLHFASILNTTNLVGLVAPHHGASMDGATPVPAPAGPGYRRLVYSYGHENAHGNKSPPTRHPTPKGVAAHEGVGWLHAAWPLNEPGCPVPGGDILATCEHLPGGFRGGAVVGWDHAPPAMALMCPHNLCNAQCAQR